MMPVYILATVLAITGGTYALHQASMPPLPPVAGAPAGLADNFFVYAGAVQQFVAAQADGYTAPGAGNAVPDSSLTFPVWHLRNNRWTNKVIGGTVTIYATAVIPGVDLSEELASRTDGAFGAGITSATGEIISSVYGATGLIAPAGVPAGVPVYQVRVN